MMNNWEEISYQKHHHDWMKWDKEQAHDKVVHATTNLAISEIFKADLSTPFDSHRPLSEHTAVTTSKASIPVRPAIAVPASNEIEGVPSNEEAVVVHARPQNRVDRFPLQTSSFETVTRYVQSREGLLGEAVGREREIGQLCTDVSSGNWNAIFACYKEEPDRLSKDALKAFHNSSLNQEPKMTLEQFFTLNYCFALLKEFPDAKIQIQSLFDAQGNIDPEAQSIFKDSLFSKQLDDMGRASENFFSQAEAEEIAVTFFEKMRYALPSEQCFFYIQAPLESESLSIKISPIQRVLRDVVGLKTFDIFWLQHTPFRMMPSFSMIQALVEAYGKENAIALCPKIKISTLPDFRQNLDLRGREIYLPFFGTECPTIADGFGVSDSLAFLFHDIYHCLICAKVPYHLQREVGAIADGVAHLQQELASDKDPMVVPFLETYYERMLDLEFSNFRPEMRSNPAYKLRGLNDEEVLLFELDAQMLLYAPARMRLKRSSLIPFDQRESLTSEERAKLSFWDTLQEEVNRKFSRFPKEFAPPESTVKAQLFKEMCNEFYLKNDVVKLLAKQIYDSGLLKRLNLTQDNLEDVQTALTARYGRKYASQFLTHHLLEIYQQARGEVKSQ